MLSPVIKHQHLVQFKSVCGTSEIPISGGHLEGFKTIMINSNSNNTILENQWYKTGT